MTSARPLPFVLASTQHGSMIVNRNDYCEHPDGSRWGVTAQIFNQSFYDLPEVDFLKQLLTLRRKLHGDGVQAIDCGANIGVHTIEWSRHMAHWGKVFAIEAQERVFYALAGNIALNNCLNASAQHLAVGGVDTHIQIPELDPNRPASFGSLEIKERATGTESIGQAVDYTPERMVSVQQVRLDGLVGTGRLDLLKIDVEGMEMETLEGASAILTKSRPFLFIEWIKSDVQALVQYVRSYGYEVWQYGGNFLAIHQDDPAVTRVRSGVDAHTLTLDLS